MKKMLAGFLALAFLFQPAVAAAHPANDIKFEYNAGEKRLAITVIHGIRDSSKHFIDSLKVAIDGKEMIKQIFMSQYDNKGQETAYIIIDAKEKQTVKADSHCIKGGDFSKEFTLK
jgi:hypothetical protein